MIQPSKKRLLFFGLCSGEGKMSTQDDLKVSVLVKAVTSRFAEESGSGPSAKNPKLNVEIVKTGILRHFRTMSFETT
jgi:hypothetical protein